MTEQAIVIGAGPAGLSAALGFLRLGFRVSVLEKNNRPTDRVCGSFLSSEAVRNLDWLGLLNEAHNRDAVPVPSVAITHNSLLSPKLVSTTRNNYTALALARPQLESLMREEIEKQGGEIVWNAWVENIQEYNQTWTIKIRNKSARSAAHVVMADGRFSQFSNTNSKHVKSGWYGWRATFENANQKPGDMVLHLTKKGYVGTLTFSDGTTNVCGLTIKNQSDSDISWNQVWNDSLNENRHLKNILCSARKISDWRGVGPLPFSKKMNDGKGILLAGDAAGVSDPFMGEGIGRALAAGPMIYHAFQTGRKYGRLWSETYNPRFNMGSVLRGLLSAPNSFKSVGTRILLQDNVLQWITRRFQQGFIAATN
jgi:flavin-dependent dehydrogenase